MLERQMTGRGPAAAMTSQPAGDASVSGASAADAPVSGYSLPTSPII
jgi:hypothetical protein